MPETGKSPQILAAEWIAAWNAHDLARIMEHYAEDVEFTASTVARRWQRTDGTLRGKAELREHFRLGLELAPDLHFELLEVFETPGGYAVLYQRDNGNQVIDAVTLNAAGKAQRVTAYYKNAQR